MSDQEPDPSGSLSTHDEERIRRVCDAIGFPLGEIDATGAVLRLSPTSLEELPDATTLHDLADRLETDGFRYVTFTVPEPTDPS